MDPDKIKALSSFYREEFERYLSHLEAHGIAGCDADAQRVCRRFIDDLDHVCCRSEFPALAETLLRRFDALARLSEIEPRKSH